MEFFDFTVGHFSFQLHQQLGTDFTAEIHKSHFAQPLQMSPLFNSFMNKIEINRHIFEHMSTRTQTMLLNLMQIKETNSGPPIQID